MSRGQGRAEHDADADLQLDASPLGRALLPRMAQDEALRNPAALRAVRDVMGETFERLSAGKYHSLACEFGRFVANLGFELDRLKGGTP